MIPPCHDHQQHIRANASSEMGDQLSSSLGSCNPVDGCVFYLHVRTVGTSYRYSTYSTYFYPVCFCGRQALDSVSDSVGYMQIVGGLREEGRFGANADKRQDTRLDIRPRHG